MILVAGGRLSAAPRERAAAGADPYEMSQPWAGPVSGLSIVVVAFVSGDWLSSQHERPALTGAGRASRGTSVSERPAVGIGDRQVPASGGMASGSLGQLPRSEGIQRPVFSCLAGCL